jgi:divalent metal cation (Fe/Co/Zn/Cd) transporter
VSAIQTARLRRRGLRLEYLTIAWNLVEGVVAVSAGIAAGSIALVGFGFDSTIEVFAAIVVVCQFRADERGGINEERERRALRLIAVTFFVLAAYVTVEAARDLLSHAERDTSVVGIVLACLSLLVMPARSRSARPDASSGAQRSWLTRPRLSCARGCQPYC